MIRWDLSKIKHGLDENGKKILTLRRTWVEIFKTLSIKWLKSMVRGWGWNLEHAAFLGLGEEQNPNPSR